MSRFQQTKRDSETYRQSTPAGRFIMVGSNFMAGIGLLAFAGHWLDKKTGHSYRYTLIGALLGLLWGTYEAIKLAMFLNQKEEPKQDEKPHA